MEPFEKASDGKSVESVILPYIKAQASNVTDVNVNGLEVTITMRNRVVVVMLTCENAFNSAECQTDDYVNHPGVKHAYMYTFDETSFGAATKLFAKLAKVVVYQLGHDTSGDNTVDTIEYMSPNAV